MSSGYPSELDYTPFLVDNAVYYMELIGILCWIMELGHIDIMVAVYLLSSNSMQLWMGHLDQAFHIFGYLKGNKRVTLIFKESHVN
jgi:hypothetical protein